jgi:hypothetical protein
MKTLDTITEPGFVKTVSLVSTVAVQAHCGSRTNLIDKFLVTIEKTINNSLRALNLGGSFVFLSMHVESPRK